MADGLSDLTIGVLGGTGPLGKGLARRWCAAGLRVMIGSRAADRAQAVAAEIAAPEGTASGADNFACAQTADVVVVAVPWDGHADLLKSVADATAGKLVVDVVNPLGFDKRGPFRLDVPEGSAAEQAAALLPRARVAAAFHHVSAVLLNDTEVDEIGMDVLVLGEEREDTDLVRSLADAIPGMRGVYAGRLRNAGQVEALTANLIAINRRYKTHAGITVTGI
ncbi:MAG TPA: NADPH-dependent F420 reductase [Nocardioidaceae bacterium]|nr:NADPH-dependent F420 reductase [Nocardioidaceae bacterium]